MILRRCLLTSLVRGGFIEMEREVPAETTASINFLSTALLTFSLSLIIIDVDPELTFDNTLAPPFDLKIMILTFQ